jgi:hypothetical protein
MGFRGASAGSSKLESGTSHLVTAGCRSSPGRSEPAIFCGVAGRRRFTADGVTRNCLRSGSAALEPRSRSRCESAAVHRGEHCCSLAPCRVTSRRRTTAEAMAGLRDLANRLKSSLHRRALGCLLLRARLPVLRFGPKLPASTSRAVLVVSHHLDGFLHPGVAGLLHPAADHGIRRVSPRIVRQLPGWTGAKVPATPVHTPRRSPLDRSRTASPQPLPPRRFHDLEALLRSRAPHRRPTIAGLKR